MGLNVKMALLTCLFFTGGVAWLVNQVARPLVELPSPLINRAAAASTSGQPRSNDSPERSSEPPVRQQFVRSSPVAPVSAPPQPLADAAQASGVAAAQPANRVHLPPLNRPAVQDVAASEAVRGAPVTLVSDEQPIQTALVRDIDNPGSDAMLAATRPHNEADAAAVAQNPPTPAGSDEPIAYVVKRGDTLTKICKEQLGDDGPAEMRAMLAANPKLAKRPDRVLLGESLTIPTSLAVAAAPADTRPKAGEAKNAKTASAAARKPDTTATKRGDKRTVLASTERTEQRAATSAKTNSPQSRQLAKSNAASSGKAGRNAKADKKKPPAKVAQTKARRWYTIRKEDSLRTISRRMLNDESRWRDIMKLNGLKDADHIPVGSRIKLPDPSEGRDT